MDTFPTQTKEKVDSKGEEKKETTMNGSEVTRFHTQKRKKVDSKGDEKKETTINGS